MIAREGRRTRERKREEGKEGRGERGRGKEDTDEGAQRDEEGKAMKGKQ